METKSTDVSTASGIVNSSSISDAAAGFVSDSAWGPEFMFITVIRFKGSNYTPWAKSVEVYMMAKGLDTYLTDAPPDYKYPSYATWKVKDARIRLRMWNSIEPHITSSLVYLTSAKQVWDQATKMFSGVGNLRRTYDLHQTFFSITLGDTWLEDYYVRFLAAYEKIRLSEGQPNCPALIILVTVVDLAMEFATIVPKADVVTPSVDKYKCLLTTQSSPAINTLAQTRASTMCVTSQIPWVIDPVPLLTSLTLLPSY
ncbi:hypothetical protein Acr_25g0004560 [Actinidia rufa]|uniref:Retrotransposon Copia-like N-terminal domain-containing protein n=1 Tax=Actinidia rufa TaxID=165716 RepID=A0A7J0GYY5_9ERIC|nr:hypothetical protein Acr_25g0004560 [Actinidia rufa]